MCQIRTPIDVDMQVAMATVWGTTCDSHAGLETSWCLPNDAIATVHAAGAIAPSHADGMSRLPSMCPICTPIDVDMQLAMATVWGTTCNSHTDSDAPWCIPNDAITTVHAAGAIAMLHIDGMSRLPLMCQIRTPIDVDMQVAMAAVWGTTCDSHAGLETSWCLPNDAIATVHGQGAIALSHVDDMSRCP